MKNKPVLGLDHNNVNQNIKTFLIEHLDKKRYAHSLQVAIKAAQIAEHYSCSTDKAYLAGLLHDCSRYISTDNMLEEALKCGYIADEVEIKCPILLHSKISAYIAQVRYGIGDLDVLSAIANHTTGVDGMGLLDKIIYIADYIEPTRNLNKKLLAEIEYWLFECKNIERALLLVLDGTIRYLSEVGKIIHPRTIKLKFSLTQSLLMDNSIDSIDQ